MLGPGFARPYSKACSDKLHTQVKVPGAIQIWWHRWKLTPHCRQWDIPEPHSPAAPGAFWEPEQGIWWQRGCGEWWRWGQSLSIYSGSVHFQSCHHQRSQKMKAQLVSRSFYKPVLSKLLLVKIRISVRVSASLWIMPLIWVTLSSIKH